MERGVQGISLSGDEHVCASWFRRGICRRIIRGDNKRMARVFLAMGSNMGDRWMHLSMACRSLAQLQGVQLVQWSPVYETAPVGGPAGQGMFLNAVVELQAQLEPVELLARMQAIERAAGRPARDERAFWGPRPLDLDVLLYGRQVIKAPGLRVPHPRLHERWFVLRPLADLAPDLRHPEQGLSVAELVAQVPADDSAVRYPAASLGAAEAGKRLNQQVPGTRKDQA